MGDLEDLVPLAKSVVRDILGDCQGRDNVRSDLAQKVLVSEGQMRGPKNESQGGKTFILNLKSDDVLGALQGMRTVFGEPDDVPKDDVPRPKRKVKEIEAEPKDDVPKEVDIEKAMYEKVIAAEKAK